MKSAIITGAAGFLGSHLSETLLKQGFHVVGTDNFCTGLRSNAQLLKKHSSFHFFEADVVQPWNWLDQVSSEILSGCQYVFHFASPASPPHYQRMALETMRVNTVGLENALTNADRLKARVVFASTSEVYGDPEVSPQPESYWGKVNSFGERSCYDESKRYGEAFIFSWNRIHSTNHGLVRIFNTYGPRMNPADGRVVINFIVQALKGEPLTIYGDGSQTRSFCYVDDLIDGILKYAATRLQEPVNIGNDKEFTVIELAQVVQKVVAPSPLENRPLPADDPRRRRPDLAKARALLSPWQPRVPLEEGVRKMADWIRKEGL